VSAAAVADRRHSGLSGWFGRERPEHRHRLGDFRGSAQREPSWPAQISDAHCIMSLAPSSNRLPLAARPRVWPNSITEIRLRRS